MCFKRTLEFLNHQCSIWVLLRLSLNVLLSSKSSCTDACEKVERWAPESALSSLYTKGFIPWICCLILPFLPSVVSNYSLCFLESLLERLLICVSKWMSHGRILSRKFLPWIKKLKFWIHCRAKQNCSGEIVLSFAYSWFLHDCPRMFRLGCIFECSPSSVIAFDVQISAAFSTKLCSLSECTFPCTVSSLLQNTFSFLFLVCLELQLLSIYQTSSLPTNSFRPI